MAPTKGNEKKIIIIMDSVIMPLQNLSFKNVLLVNML